MSLFIDPKVDCVFKALLGSPENANLLMDFLNAILQPPSPVVSVEILNPYNEKMFIGDKLTIVDVKARDEQDQLFQVEIQLVVRAHLAARQLYTWAELYESQLSEGRDFDALRPVRSIWLLDGRQLPDDVPHHHFQLRDRGTNLLLTDHASIHVLELPKWRRSSAALTPADRWLYFFKEAGDWSDLPPELKNPEMEQAMETLKRFSERERELLLYRERLNNLREYRFRQRELQEVVDKLQQARTEVEQVQAEVEQARTEVEQARAAEEQARVAEEQERVAKEQALAEKEHLAALLRHAGIDPGAPTGD